MSLILFRKKERGMLITDSKMERKILRAFLLAYLYQTVCEQLVEKGQEENNYFMESYIMDSTVVRFLIQSILETNEYTLEGIARYTRIPFDIIFEAACGIKNQVSIGTSVKIMNLFLQVKPDMMQHLVKKLLTFKEKNPALFSFFLLEE